jgi:glutathione S-transferase
LWLLEELGAPYEVKVVSIRRGNGSGARDPANPHPHGKVPAIVHNDKTVFETTAITLYLTDEFPEADLSPKIGDPDRAAYVTWLSYFSGVFEPSLTFKLLGIEQARGTFGWAPFGDVMAYLNRTLEAQPYFLGEQFSAVDIVFGGSLPLMMARGMVPESELLTTYVARITARPGFARAQAKDATYRLGALGQVR